MGASQQPNNSSTQHNGNSASSPSTASSTAQSPAMLSRFLYDRTSVQDRLVARSFNAATQGSGHDAAAAELEHYMSQSSSNAQAGGSNVRQA
ncbi:hypothetical protein CFAM422_011626 [Trichoderma lentiforme]|uniref:Uncharacterized protein n=1 Tax=Trichoderma lentiforme TaxID=1567552 RepID=A0A9P5C759_9HYPO|nr:hypothetical protein CFAM422_011626 [Trichoderma lentiforme]